MDKYIFQVEVLIKSFKLDMRYIHGKIEQFEVLGLVTFREVLAEAFSVLGGKLYKTESFCSLMAPTPPPRRL